MLRLPPLLRAVPLIFMAENGYIHNLGIQTLGPRWLILQATDMELPPKKTDL